MEVDGARGVPHGERGEVSLLTYETCGWSASWIEADRVCDVAFTKIVADVRDIHYISHNKRPRRCSEATQIRRRILALCGFVAGLALWISSPADETHDIEYLTRQARESSIFERLRAIRALGRSGDPRAVDPLVDLLQSVEHEDIQVEAAHALGTLGDNRDLETPGGIGWDALTQASPTR